VQPVVKRPELPDDSPDLVPCHVLVLAAELSVHADRLLLIGKQPARQEHPLRVDQRPGKNEPRQVQPLQSTHHAQAPRSREQAHRLVVVPQHGGAKRRQFLRRIPVVVHAISQQPVAAWSHTLATALTPTHDPGQSTARPACFAQHGVKRQAFSTIRSR